MRFILIILIWILIAGGLGSYFWQRNQGQPLNQNLRVEEAAAIERYDLFVTPTFGVEPDPFALDEDDALDTAFTVQLNGQKLPLAIDTLERGLPISLKSLQDLHQGINEIYVKASPPMTEAHLEHGVRVVLTHEDEPIVDQTIWSSGGGVVSGTVTFELETPEAADDH